MSFDLDASRVNVIRYCSNFNHISLKPNVNATFVGCHSQNSIFFYIAAPLMYIWKWHIYPAQCCGVLLGFSIFLLRSFRTDIASQGIASLFFVYCCLQTTYGSGGKVVFLSDLLLNLKF